MSALLAPEPVDGVDDHGRDVAFPVGLESHPVLFEFVDHPPVFARLVETHGLENTPRYLRVTWASRYASPKMTNVKTASSNWLSIVFQIPIRISISVVDQLET